MMRGPHTHAAGEVGGSSSVAEAGWGTVRRSRVRVGVTRESAGHGSEGDKRWLFTGLDARKKQGLLPEGRKAKI